MMATPQTTMDDTSLIQRAEQEISEERVLAAARLLRQVKDTSKLSEKLLKDLDVAADFEASIADMLTFNPKEEGWTKQAEKHAKFDTAIWYKVDKNHHLTCRMEAAIPASLLVPIIAAMNECELYGTWMPSWRFPRIGYRRVSKLRDFGRGNLIYQVIVDMPPPYHARDAVVQYVTQYLNTCVLNRLLLHLVYFSLFDSARAIDEIDFGSKIIVRAKPLKTKDDDDCVPDLERRTVRIDLDATLVIQACPLDHPLLVNSKINYPKGERILLFTAKQCVDAHVSYVPISLINFFTRQFLQTFLVSFLSVGVAIRDGKHPEYQKAMESKPDLYEWVSQRVKLLFEKMDNDCRSST